MIYNIVHENTLCVRIQDSEAAGRARALLCPGFVKNDSHKKEKRTTFNLRGFTSQVDSNIYSHLDYTKKNYTGKIRVTCRGWTRSLEREREKNTRGLGRKR